MKKLICTVMLAAIAFGVSAEDAKKQQSFEKFQKQQEEMLINEALLSESEAQTFMPIYREYKKKQHELGHQKMKLTRESRDKFDAVLSQLAEIGIQEAQLRKDFYAQGSKAIGAEKMFRIVRAEERFHRNMFAHGGKMKNQKGEGAKGSSPRSKAHPSQGGKGPGQRDQKPSQQPQQN